jgi:hypothetical protein
MPGGLSIQKRQNAMNSFVARENAMQLQCLDALLVCNTFDCLAAPDFDKPVVLLMVRQC